MTWLDGKLVPDDTIRINVRDRTFMHGLGLFETFRSWRGHAPLLGRHLERLTRSAGTLRVPLRGVVLPDEKAVSSLLGASGPGDHILRVVLSGGISEDDGAHLWMTSWPLPMLRRKEVCLAAETWAVDRDDPLNRHKTLNYWVRQRAFQRACATGHEEILSRSADGRYWEGSRTNLFIVRGDRLSTPSREGPIVPGIMRSLVLDLAATLPCDVKETDGLGRDEIEEADEVFLTNSVRGVLPVDRIGPQDRLGPRPWTDRLAGLVNDRLTKRTDRSDPPC